MSLAKQPSLMESYNNIEDNSTWFCHPSEVNTQCFLVQWVFIPKTTFVSVIYLFSFFSGSYFSSCQWFYLALFWTPWFSLKNVPSYFRASIYYSVYFLLFCSILFLLPDALSLYTLHCNAQSNKIHYFCWFCSITNWEGILPPTHLMYLIFGSIADPINCGQNSELPVTKLW